MKRRDFLLATAGLLALCVARAQTPCPPPQLGVEGGSSTATTCPAPSGTYSTNFDVAENPLSENGRWHRANNAWTNVQTFGGVAFGTNGVTNGYDDSYALLSGFGPDQTAEATVFRDASLTPSVTHEVELLLRASDDANNARGYECLFNWAGGIQIVRWNGAMGDFTVLPILNERSLGRPLATGDVIKGSIVGNTIRVYINGNEMGRAVDSTFSTGQPGISFFIRPGGHQRLLGLTSYTATSP
jgi:hypothetical protein